METETCGGDMERRSCRVRLHHTWFLGVRGRTGQEPRERILVLTTFGARPASLHSFLRTNARLYNLLQILHLCLPHQTSSKTSPDLLQKIANQKNRLPAQPTDKPNRQTTNHITPTRNHGQGKQLHFLPSFLRLFLEGTNHEKSF